MLTKGGEAGDDSEAGLGFITTTSAVNTANAVVVLYMMFLIGKSRSGAAIALGRLLPVPLWSGAFPPSLLLHLLAAILFTIPLAALATRHLGRWLAENFHRLPYRQTLLGIIIMVTVMVGLFTGLKGLSILVVATCLGRLPPRFGIRRSHGMGVLVLPVLIWLSQSMIG